MSRNPNLSQNKPRFPPTDCRFNSSEVLYPEKDSEKWIVEHPASYKNRAARRADK